MLLAWEAKRITILSLKTEHHEGHELRVIPMCDRIETALRNLWLEAEPGAERVFPTIRGNTNLRTGLEKIIARAGVQQWPKLWVNLRASGATDLARALPAHVAASICGHSVEVAREHYWRTSDTDLNAALSVFDKAKQKPKQLLPATVGNATQRKFYFG